MRINIKRLIVIPLLVPLLLLTQPAAAQYLDPDNAREDYFSRMFIAPTGRILPSGVISVAFGGAFASQGGREYLGLFSVGLGGIAELEISTLQIVTNILDLSEPIGTTSLRFMLYQGDPDLRLPTVIMALRSNRWSNVSGGGDELSGPAAPGGEYDIGSVEFQTHITSLYLAATSRIYPTITLHGGLTFNEIRTRDLRYNDSGIIPPGDMKKGSVSWFFGVERLVNENTYSMLEIGSIPRIEFNDDLQKMTTEQITYGMVGVRFFVTDWTAVDAGLRYRSDFTGLADTEIRAGLNVGLDIAKEIGEIRGRK